MTPYKYEVLFYQNKRFTGTATFDNVKEASEHLLACIGRYMDNDGFYTNMESSYCVSVFDLSPKEHMIQLLGPIDDSTKKSLKGSFDDFILQKARNIIHNK